MRDDTKPAPISSTWANIDRWLNRLSNSAVIFVAIAVVAWHLPIFTEGRVTPPAQSLPVEYHPGDILDLPRLGISEPSLILALRSTGRACAESAGFYRSLSGVPIVVVATESLEVNRTFLDTHGISASRVITLEESGLDVMLVPTLILVGPDGRVIKSWRGRLPRSDESEIRNLLKEVRR